MAKEHEHGKPAGNARNGEENRSAHTSFPVVGLGASAGGLEALKAFFQNVPADSGMAYVVVVHLSPDHPSAMPELLGRVASIPVDSATDGGRLEPNHAYVAPPGNQLSISNGTMQLVEPRQGEPHLGIDTFLRSLAKDQQANAAAVILSGTGADGSAGVKQIKGADGLVLVQSAETAEHSGMPRNAIATGVVDREASPQEMPGILANHFAHRAKAAARAASLESNEVERQLAKVFAIVRTQMGHDFAGYKRSTLLRRVQRRMGLQQVTGLDDYVRFLRANPAETEALFREFLIGVTHFFRDEESFDQLRESALPALLQGVGQDDTLRAWVPGCSTGEEAYSVAMTLREAIDRHTHKRLSIQVFGTDIDSWAIQRARLAQYPASIAADVSEERLKRFFVKEGKSYRVRKDIRESVIFSVQDLLKDPPFSRLHLLCCRNVLIYLGRKEQDRLLRLFHYTLKPEGVMMLGSSETVGSYNRLFETIDARWKIYRRQEVPPGVRGTIDFPTGHTTDSREPEQARGEGGARPTDFAELTKSTLLESFAPTALLVDDEGSIIHVLGRTGRYLEQSTGPATNNVVDMAREGVRLEISSALRAARGSQETVQRHGITVQTNGDSVTVDLTVKPIVSPPELAGRYLIVFQEIDEYYLRRYAPTEREDASEEEQADRIAQLEQELTDTRQSHQATVEELEAANEELRSTNEEMQSSNEELQSTNEELESSKEELQSLNEELNTVNSELQSKLEELTAANDDMRNLLNSTEVASIFVDGDLRIRRYTDRATELVNLIEGDVGRPLRHVSTNLAEENLVEDVEAVVDRLTPISKELSTTNGRWYKLTVTPYRTTDNRIDGAVLTFVDVHAQKEVQEQLEAINNEKDASLELVRQVIDMNPQALVVLDQDGTVALANSSFCQLVNTDAEALVGQDLLDGVRGFEDTAELEHYLKEAVENNKNFKNIQAALTLPEGGFDLEFFGRVVPRIEGLPYRILISIRKVTE